MGISKRFEKKRHRKEKKWQTKGQTAASGTAALIAIIGGLILVYILFIPADMRENLLNGNLTAGNGNSIKNSDSFKYNKTLLEESPGRIDYLAFKEYEHNIPSVNLYTTKTSKSKDIADYIYVKNGIFDKKSENRSFYFSEDINNINNLFLSFGLNSGIRNKGILRVYFNGKKIYERPSGNMLNKPIRVPDDIIQRKNTISFSVSGVSWKFWTTNEYGLDNIRIFYDYTDTSQQQSKNIFTITDTEKFNMKKATIRFNPNCRTASTGKLHVYINNNEIYSAVPDCNQINLVEFSTSLLEAGNNRVVFIADKGNFLIDQIKVKTEMRRMNYPVYYFEMDERFFVKREKDIEYNNYRCGDIDGYCPRNCDEDIDKDCCFETGSNYWCDYPTDNNGDRCRPVIKEEDCGLCRSGYEDRKGNAPEVCEGKCGDDNDGECPAGCNKYYDKDCCFDESDNNYWCDDLPENGMKTCEQSMRREQCEFCYSGWKTNSYFKCSKRQGSDVVELKPKYDIKLMIKFADKVENKAAKVFVNGYEFYIDTNSDTYVKYLDNYVEDGSNSIKIEPDNSVLDIRKLVVEVEEH